MTFISNLRSLALGLTIALVSLPPYLAHPRAEDASVAEPAAVRAFSMAELANEQRAKAGLSPLRINDRLMRAAQTQAEQNAALAKLAHVLPEAKFPRPQDRIEAAGYSWRAFAENIAYGQPSPSSAVEAWMKSPGHRDNLLNPKYTELGTGFAMDAAGRPYYVQVFGRPL